MTQLLALNQKTNVEMLAMSIPRPRSGVPINALPGWDDVPLSSKLPMLKCPTNQIIFTRAQIGKRLHTLGEFKVYDPYLHIIRIDYDSLHDPHLRKYYLKENNLKRLRDIKKITKNNDVICTLKEFNRFRLLLEQYHLGLIKKEIEKRENEQRDRAAVFHAESIAAEEYMKFAKKRKRLNRLKKGRTKKEKAEKIRQEKLSAKLKKMKTSMERIQKLKDLKKEILAEKMRLHNLTINQRRNLALQMESKRIIALKKRFAERDSRLRKQKRQVHIQKLDITEQKAIKTWEKLLKSRTKQHERNTSLLKEAEERKMRNIEKRRQRLKRQWRSIQVSIAKRSKNKTSKRKKKNSISRTKSTKSYKSGDEKDGYDDTLLKSLARRNIPEMVNIALDVEEKVKKWGDYPDCTVKVAKYILDVVIKNFKTDLSKNTETMELLAIRIGGLFKSLKNIQIVKVGTILMDTTKNKSKCRRVEGSTASGKRFERCVSFGNSTQIGLSLQEIRSGIEIKRARSRPPTPAGSLGSIAPVVYATETDIEISPTRKSIFAYCSKEERIYIEHIYIKFRRALIVGVSRKVMDAVRCYWNDQILNPRKELLDIDRQYLITTMARSILSYAINSYNFYGNLKLCINALSADIIWELQEHLLKPRRDIRFIRPPKCRCSYECAGGMR